jgi:hypothetical protein
MGSPIVIKVDTEKLRATAKTYIARSDAVKNTWTANKFAIDLVMDHIPASYDGKLTSSVRSDELDFTNRINGFSDWFQEDAASLIKTAEAFEVMDGQTVQILQDADDGITRASLIDSGVDLGLSTTITTEVIESPKGTLPKITITITTVRTINPNGTVTTTKTTQTVIELDKNTAADLNENKKNADTIIGFVIPTAVGFVNPILGLITKSVFTGIQLYKNHNPDRGFQEGDTITITTTVVTTDSLETLPSSNPIGEEPEVTTTIVVTDSDGNIVSEEKTSNDIENLID